MSGIMLESDHFEDVFLDNPFGIIFGLSNIFYSGSIFESQELFDKHNDFIDDHEYHEVQSIPHDHVIIERKKIFFQNPIFKNLIGSTSKMVATVEDTTMDVV